MNIHYTSTVHENKAISFPQIRIIYFTTQVPNLLERFHIHRIVQGLKVLYVFVIDEFITIILQIPTEQCLFLRFSHKTILDVPRPC